MGFEFLVSCFGLESRISLLPLSPTTVPGLSFRDSFPGLTFHLLLTNSNVHSSPELLTQALSQLPSLFVTKVLDKY